MLKSFFFLLFGIFFFSGSALAVDCRIAASAIQVASKLRGLSVVGEVPCQLQDREEVEKYIREQIGTKIPIEKIEGEGAVFRLLGLVPEDFDYLNGLVDLYTSQIGGYYDPEKDYYVMAAWMPVAMQMPIAVHELTHALQDQHYDLSKLINDQNAPSDALMARSALVEGDATAIMMDYSRSLMGQGSIAEDESVSVIVAQNIAGAMLSSVMSTAPTSLQAMLVFPYISGLNFAHVLLKKGGYGAIDKAFGRLPSSTEEILHPEKYLQGKRDYREVAIPAPPKGLQLADTKPVHVDSLGEFFISALLGTWISPYQASRAAAGWGGDKLSLYLKDAEDKSLNRYLLRWVSYWDSVKDAEEFQAAISGAYIKRFSANSKKIDATVTFSSTSIGNIKIVHTDKRVEVVIGL